MHDFTRIEEVRRWCDEFARRFPPLRTAMSGGHERAAMAVDGYGASVMLAPRLEGDHAHRLPPGVSAPAYPVAPYEGCPSGWRRKNDAFFVPIPMDAHGKGPGMWYDWTM
ncbi:MAG: hypothetical protein Q8R16_05400, partial [bacterium]|nr:hypothetical protein [bacterium]